MYQYSLHQPINRALRENGIAIAGEDNMFYTRMVASATTLQALYQELYGEHPKGALFFERLIRQIVEGYQQRPISLRERDEAKPEYWFLSQELAGMSLYVDRWCGRLDGLPDSFGYLKKLGVNLLHLMPVFQSPEGASDGGYAVSDFRKVDERFGSLADLRSVGERMRGQGMYLMLDIVLNHTSDRHEWAEKAKQGDLRHQDFYYMFPDRYWPDQYDRGMPEVFPESSPGNFTYVEACKKWVMTVFHHYQWDLNYRNPEVFVAMLDTILFYANLGVDILRIDAPAFIWKDAGTTCQNLPKAHTLLRLIKQCVQIAAPGMALLGEAIVAPSAIMKYFGTGPFTAKECDLAYNATQMALQWDALATADTRVMLAAQYEILQKPYGTSWITYTRCHDDIGMGYEDYMIRQAGYEPLGHRKFLQDYYSGKYPGSDAMGALFSVNPKTQDARISGSLASLCGLEKALEEDAAVKARLGMDVGNERLEKFGTKIGLAIRKILLMQAQSFFIGGIPMLFYGDEAGYTNDYSYLADPGKSYDNRWMHRPVVDWRKNQRTVMPGTVEERIFSGTKKLLEIRKKLAIFSDRKNLTWLTPHNIHVAGFLRADAQTRVYCLFNFSREEAFLTWHVFKEHGEAPLRLHDHWSDHDFIVGKDEEYLIVEPYGFMVLEVG